MTKDAEAMRRQERKERLVARLQLAQLQDLEGGGGES